MEKNKTNTSYPLGHKHQQIWSKSKKKLCYLADRLLQHLLLHHSKWDN